MPDTNDGQFKGQMLAFVTFYERQRKEDRELEEKRHIEVLTLIKENRDTVVQKFHDFDMNCEIKHKRLAKKHDDDIDIHKSYHKENEHKWGIWTLFKRKPAIPILFGILISFLFIAAGYNLKDILQMLIKFAQ